MRDYTFFDTETSAVENGHIIELCVKRGGVAKSMRFALPEGHKMSIEAIAVHGITPDMLKNEETFEHSLMKQLLLLNLHEGVPVAHNAQFDLDMLAQYGHRFETFVDTLKVARYVWPQLPKHNLQYLRYWLQVEQGVSMPFGVAHSAEGDVQVLEAVFNEMIKELKKQTGIDDDQKIQDKMIEITKSPVALYAATFGKYKGKPWAEVWKQDSQYMMWLLGSTEDLDLRYTINRLRSGAV